MDHRLVLAAAIATSTGQQVLLVAPLVLIWLALMVAALIDLARRPAVRGSKVLWAIVIVVFSTVGPIAYFIFGRKEV
ncbi:MAG TPA: PLD nuclease N-terminal domain-containing protein [Chloroflexota bacterium]|nr:PLD nuclease N-terminal domain-containing protein [Chloroflexota bacterium]